MARLKLSCLLLAGLFSSLSLVIGGPRHSRPRFDIEQLDYQSKPNIELINGERIPDGSTFLVGVPINKATCVSH